MIVRLGEEADPPGCFSFFFLLSLRLTPPFHKFALWKMRCHHAGGFKVAWTEWPKYWITFAWDEMLIGDRLVSCLTTQLKGKKRYWVDREASPSCTPPNMKTTFRQSSEILQNFLSEFHHQNQRFAEQKWLLFIVFLIAQNVLFAAGWKQKAKYAVLLESSMKNIDLKMIVGGL